jgi:Bifunctional DNA primase/polymerase, N-terminal
LHLDDDEGVVEASGIPVNTRIVESSPGHRQYYFRHTGESALVGNIPQRAGFSLRSHNYYGLAAGSRHPKGHFYRLLADLPIQPMPADLLNYLVNRYEMAKTALGGELQILNGRKLGEGQGRNDDMVRLAGLIWRGQEEQEFFNDLSWACELRHDPPHPESRIWDVVHRAMRDWDPGPGLDLVDLLPDDSVLHGYWHGFVWYKNDPAIEWLHDADEFLAKILPRRKPYMVDSETGAVLLYEKSINQIFATRGLGKSVVNNALLRPLIKGGDWLKFHSEGGLGVVLVDGELPDVQLQERLREFTETQKGS